MPKPAKPARKTPKDPYRMRPCRLCKAKFKPTTHVVSCADTQEFCCPNHRKEYWKYGGLPFDKLIARIEKRCREIVKEEIAARFPETEEPKTVSLERHRIPPSASSLRDSPSVLNPL